MSYNQRSAGHGFAIAVLVGTIALAVVVGGTILLAVAVRGSSSKGATSTVTVTSPSPASTPVSQPTDPNVIAGAYDFTQFACAQCHGLQGQGGVSPYVPALKTVGATLTAARLKGIIDHGLGISSNPKRPFMPVWGPVISARQAADLVAYIKAGLPAVPNAAPRAVPPGTGKVATGAILYGNYGCVNCHGPNGLGGVPNPQSPDKSIPPLSGADFRKEFSTPAKIRAVIESGSVLGGSAIVSMPHWGGILTRAQLDALVAYIATLR
jgi:mono/diheme cytochrome c family protein